MGPTYLHHFYSSVVIDKSLPIRLLITKEKKWKAAEYGGTNVHIRRLSTKASALVKENDAVGLTDWKWYWKRDTG